MSTKELVQYRDILIKAREEIIARILQLEESWKNLSEREIELGDEVQKASITRSYDSLGAEGRARVALIDLALSKMMAGDYGICESCEDDIPPKRLEAVPWTRLCVDCARDHERKPISLPQPVEVMASVKLPDELRGLTSAQLLRLIHERIDEDGQIGTEDLRISVQSGTIYLDGSLANDVEHQLLIQILMEDLGIHAIIDRLKLVEIDDESPFAGSSVSAESEFQESLM